MVGRNEPCPCGSGKKYKKCHGKNASGDLNTVITEEINRVVEGFIQEHYVNVHTKFQTRQQEWSAVLNRVFPTNIIDAIAFESLIYVDEADAWKAYITKQVNSDLRQQVKDVISTWSNPQFILAKIVSSTEEQITLKDELTSKEYVMKNVEGLVESSWVFSIFMQDPRQGENGLTITSSVVPMQEQHAHIKDALLAKLQAGETNSLELYKTFSDVLATEAEAAQEASEKVKDVAVTEVTEATISTEEISFDAEVVALTNKYLNAHNLEATAFIEKLETFLSTEEVKAKKAATVAASAVLAGQTAGLIPEGGLSKVKDVAEYFEVSSSSLSKYRKQITEFLGA